MYTYIPRHRLFVFPFATWSFFFPDDLNKIICCCLGSNPTVRGRGCAWPYDHRRVQSTTTTLVTQVTRLILNTCQRICTYSTSVESKYFSCSIIVLRGPHVIWIPAAKHRRKYQSWLHDDDDGRATIIVMGSDSVRVVRECQMHSK